MSDTTYNGWTNYETWCVKLWLDDDQADQEWLTDLVCDYEDDYEATTELKAQLEDTMPDLGATMWSDLLRSALDSVNFREIVENVREDLENEDNSCDQCNATMINGTFCHVTGCPNSRKVKDDGEWITPDMDDEE
jgi:hypothetical protein